MGETNIKRGDLVTPTEKASKEFIDLAKVWGLSYPKKGEVCKVTNVRIHPIHKEFYLLTLEGYSQEICHHCFRKIDLIFNWAELYNKLELEEHESIRT